jgi:predicted dehydrogenase
MIKVGITGIGFMGWIHFLAYQKLPGVEVVAICEMDPKKRTGDWSGIQGNFGPPAGQVDLTHIKTYESLDQMVLDPDVDFIDLCTPPSVHLEGIKTAAAAGKHVFCEKPLGLTLEQCDQAVSVCHDANVRLFVGHVLPYFVEYEFLVEAIQADCFGKLLGGNFKRVISDPTWLPNFYDPAKIGGPMLDLHVHDAHLIRLLFGMPTRVHSVGRTRGEVVSYCQTIFDFADSQFCVSATSGVIDQQGRPFNHGYEVHFENATLQFEFAAFSDAPEAMPLKILHADGSIERPKLGDGDPVFAFQREIAEVICCLSEDKESKILNATLARDAIEICQLQSNQLTQQLTQPHR